MLDLYDGEQRTRKWWHVIITNSLAISFLLALGVAFSQRIWPSFSLNATLFGVEHALDAFALTGDLLLFVALWFLVIWPVLIGISFLFPRLAFCFFYGNVWILLLAIVPSAFLASYLGTSGASPPMLYPLLVGVTILVKTGVLLRRYRLVIDDRGRQRLPL